MESIETPSPGPVPYLLQPSLTTTRTVAASAAPPAPPAPPVPTTATRQGLRRSLRPSTAPPAEQRTAILPCIPSARDSKSSLTSTTESTVSNAGRFRKSLDGCREFEETGGIAITTMGDWDTPATVAQAIECAEGSESNYDWATFISAYTSGRWDPLRTPNPPRPSLMSVYLSEGSNTAGSSTSSSSALSSDACCSTPSELSSQSSSLLMYPIAEVESGKLLDDSASVSANSSDVTAGSRFIGPSQLPSFPGASHRLRASLADLRSPSAKSSAGPLTTRRTGSSNPEVVTAAATMRWAAASVDLSPLSLPSPEHELTDPMRDHTTTIPGSHLYDSSRSNDRVISSRTRKSRMLSFWEGTQDVDEIRRLTPIEGSPPIPHDRHANSEPNHDAQLSLPCPASAPTERVANVPNGDYFGNVETAQESSKETQRALMHVVAPDLEMGALSVPVPPRTVILTRQASSPLPMSTPREAILPGGRIVPEITNSLKTVRAAKEEQLFTEFGYLPPPIPPDEAERRRALFKFNIWKTGPDLNFDRIAHLAKLVFNTKIVILSLIDGNEQWFKSEWGMKMTGCTRMVSFCGHVLLQRSDEPMVVLDTHQDWRFAKNPHVTGEPNIRFYAGAPLRTQDNYNIGSLAVICDTPRQDFTPRQRHTLKEFAAIAMRELELWRDKIQLRVRDRIQTSMEQFSRECLEIDSEQSKQDRPDHFANVMDKVYDRAAKLVMRTLDVEGVVVMDVSHCEILETVNCESSLSVVMHYGDPEMETMTRTLSLEEYGNLNSFFTKHPDGKISEGIIPFSLRPILPTHIQYALTVPIFNIDKRPFALLCAYNTSDQPKRFLEGHELSYLRAIGVIILSAVLKRRMIFADKAKSLFISNISHELRTPLHGILAAAELLADTALTHSQSSFLQTVQACGTSLVETVNHVLDFTKLSGSSRLGGVENAISPSKVNLMHLVEEAIDGCWIGHRARTELQDSGIGSVYSPPDDGGPTSPTPMIQVETIVDIGYRERGWELICEKGGIRRVLMNLFGNSLKFTTNGFIHVMLRELPYTECDSSNRIKIELSIHDTGKGISQNFLKNQLFHPFSQENPLQTGTGLGLAIVNSIVQSESVGGKVDVWSEEGVGTEIKVTFSAEVLDDTNGLPPEIQLMKFNGRSKPPLVSLVGFDDNNPGSQLLRSILINYLVSWWGFQIQTSGAEYGEIIILNNDPLPVVIATEKRDTSRPFIILSSSRGSPNTMAIASDHERIGGFCRIVHKPGGPSRLGSVLKLCLHAFNIGSRPQTLSPSVEQPWNPKDDPNIEERRHLNSQILRRRSEEHSKIATAVRPAMIPRSTTANATTPQWKVASSTSVTPSSLTPTVSVGSGGTLLKSSMGTVDTTHRRFRVLVVEDNSLLRNLLVKWLKTKGYDFREAADGRSGVNVFGEDGPFDVVLLDLSMPILDGVGATKEIRQIETVREKAAPGSFTATRILALTGMSSLEDKRQAFGAGVDGYLVKPVAFKTLDEMFHKLGRS